MQTSRISWIAEGNEDDFDVSFAHTYSSLNSWSSESFFCFSPRCTWRIQKTAQNEEDAENVCFAVRSNPKLSSSLIELLIIPLSFVCFFVSLRQVDVNCVFYVADRKYLLVDAIYRPREQSFACKHKVICFGFLCMVSCQSLRNVYFGNRNDGPDVNGNKRLQTN